MIDGWNKNYDTVGDAGHHSAIGMKIFVRRRRRRGSEGNKTEKQYEVLHLNISEIGLNARRRLRTSVGTFSCWWRAWKKQ